MRRIKTKLALAINSPNKLASNTKMLNQIGFEWPEESKAGQNSRGQFR